MKTETRYVCSRCNYKSENKAEIEACEAMHARKPVEVKASGYARGDAYPDEVTVTMDDGKQFEYMVMARFVEK
jgi:transposase-like protein